MLDHLIAVLGFAGVCAALYWLQRFAGGAAGAGCAGGEVGCHGGCEEEGRTCPNSKTS